MVCPQKVRIYTKQSIGWSEDGIEPDSFQPISLYVC